MNFKDYFSNALLLIVLWFLVACRALIAVLGSPLPLLRMIASFFEQYAAIWEGRAGESLIDREYSNSIKQCKAKLRLYPSTNANEDRLRLTYRGPVNPDFNCPVTRCLMDYPVNLSTNHAFEASTLMNICIVRLNEGYATILCPLTNKLFTIDQILNLEVNTDLQQQITAYVDDKIKEVEIQAATDEITEITTNHAKMAGSPARTITIVQPSAAAAAPMVARTSELGLHALPNRRVDSLNDARKTDTPIPFASKP